MYTYHVYTYDSSMLLLLFEKGLYTHVYTYMYIYAVGLDVARVGTQIDTKGVWLCKVPLNSLPLHQVAKSRSPDLMSDLRKMTCHHMVAG